MAISHLTLLAGIMKGMKFDQGATSSMNVHATFGISTRDQEATQVYRATRCIVRQSTSFILNIEYKNYSHATTSATSYCSQRHDANTTSHQTHCHHTRHHNATIWHG
ncbi:hypothetical protein F4604DRAFT_1761728 [Suillus subluteus]|nr:hypothetical protein F4604DRAFT_1761728 [Suillus subluteus]